MSRGPKPSGEERWSVAKAEQLSVEIESLVSWLWTLKGEEEEEEESVHDAVASRLTVPLCKLTRLLVPNVNQKIDEIVYAAEHGLEVNQGSKGVDMKDAQGRRIELKVSCVREKAGLCNVNWPLPPATLGEAERRLQLIASTKEKVGDGGYAQIVIKNKTGKDIASIRLDGAFLIEYFSRLPLPTSNNHNMGCTRCKVCKLFHRLEKLQMCSTAFAKAAFKAEEFDWVSLFADKVKSQCERRTEEKKKKQEEEEGTTDS
jgi:hypothetical protein